MTPNGADPILKLLEEPEVPPDPPEPFRMTFESRVTKSLARLEAGQLRTVAALRAMIPEVRQLQADARWKARLTKVAKVLAPAIVGALAARFPELGELLGAVLGAASAP